jgi:homoserine/homoserine lactone efflux protein
MTFETIIAFFIISLVATALPGPTMLYIASCAITQGSRGYIAAGLGVLLADFIYFLVTATGLSVILLGAYDWFFLIKWLGVAYLMYLGFKLLLNKSRVSLNQQNIKTPKKSFRRLFTSGFLVHLANPKTILFFSALLPQFINPNQPLFFQLLIIGVILLFTQATMSVIYGATANHIRTRFIQPHFLNKLNIISGGLLIAAGAWLATLRRV